MDPSKSSSVPPDYWTSLAKSGISQPAPPPYQDPPGPPYTVGYPPLGNYPNTSGYPAQPYGAPVGQPYVQGSVPGQPVTVQPVTVQPGMFVAPSRLTNPMPDYLCYSIFTMLCCCLPLGIAALVYSIMTRNANESGQRHVAEKNSRTARILNHTALGIGLALTAAYIIYIIVLFTYIKQKSSS